MATGHAHLGGDNEKIVCEQGGGKKELTGSEGGQKSKETWQPAGKRVDRLCLRTFVATVSAAQKTER